MNSIKGTVKHYWHNGVLTVKSHVLNTTPEEKLAADLDDAGVPVSRDPCRDCADPCDVGHLEYPKMFDIDTVSDMLGSVKPYLRQVVISTGKADWVREVTDEDGSLASFISQEGDSKWGPLSSSSSTGEGLSAVATTPLFPPSKPTTRIGILNGSHKSHDTDSDSDILHRVLVLPDYKVVTHVPATRGGSEDLYNGSLSTKVGRTGNGLVKGDMASYVLPYACVILLCSHKRRDNRCHIAAGKLETSFCQALEAEGWTVDHDLRDEDCMGPSLEQSSGEESLDNQSNIEAREKYMAEKLREASEGALTGQKLALLLKVSHTGGHKFAGNAIIYTPQGPGTGTGVWYGRVSPHEVPSIVKHTIQEGKVLPSLLRGGVNLCRDGNKSLLAW